MNIYKIHAVISQNKPLELAVSEYAVASETKGSYIVLINGVRHVWPKDGMKKIKTKTQNMITKDNAFISFYTKCLESELELTKDNLTANILNYASSLARNAALLAEQIKASEE